MYALYSVNKKFILSHGDKIDCMILSTYTSNYLRNCISCKCNCRVYIKQTSVLFLLKQSMFYNSQSRNYHTRLETRNYTTSKAPNLTYGLFLQNSQGEMFDMTSNDSKISYNNYKNRLIDYYRTSQVNLKQKKRELKQNPKNSFQSTFASFAFGPTNWGKLEDNCTKNTVIHSKLSTEREEKRKIEFNFNLINLDLIQQSKQTTAHKLLFVNKINFDSTNRIYFFQFTKTNCCQNLICFTVNEQMADNEGGGPEEDDDGRGRQKHRRAKQRKVDSKNSSQGDRSTSSKKSAKQSASRSQRSSSSKKAAKQTVSRSHHSKDSQKSAKPSVSRSRSQTSARSGRGRSGSQRGGMRRTGSTSAGTSFRRVESPSGGGSKFYPWPELFT